MLLAAADTVPAAAGILPKLLNICLSKAVVFVAVVPAAAAACTMAVNDNYCSENVF